MKIADKDGDHGLPLGNTNPDKKSFHSQNFY